MPILPLKTFPGPDGIFILPEAETEHWIKVRRLRRGSLLEVLLPDGTKAVAKILTDVPPLRGILQEMGSEKIQPPLPAHLGVGIVRPAAMEWMVEKLTEMGLRTLSLLYCERSKFGIHTPFSEGKLARLSKISLEAQKQSERAEPLEIRPPSNLSHWLKEFKETKSQKIFFDETAKEPRLQTSFLKKDSPEFIFLVGPEGGFSPEESKLIRQHGFEPVSLGSKRLKTETAAIYGLIALDCVYDIY